MKEGKVLIIYEKAFIYGTVKKLKKDHNFLKNVGKNRQKASQTNYSYTYLY